MIILAIETSCDETAAALVRSGREVLSSVVYSQIEEHKIYGGVVPEIASRRHIKTIDAVVEQTLKEAKIPPQEIDGVAVTAGPGLVGALLVGVNFAKGLALSLQKPLIPVHHIHGHIAANYIAFPSLSPPFLSLVASGGHSHIIDVKGYTQFTVLGRTRDDAAGEAFDKAARAMGLNYPGGSALDALAQSGDRYKYKLPMPKVEGSDMDFSFSGLKTALVNLLHTSAQRGETLDMPSLAASFQENVCGILVSKLFLAAQRQNTKIICAGGGVCANSRLRTWLEEEAKNRGIKMYIPPLHLTGDNAAMIGSQGYYEFLSGRRAGPRLNAVASLSVEHGGPEFFTV